MNSPDPVPSKAAGEKLAPGMGLTAAAFAGTPLAILTVSLLNRTVFSAQPLSAEEAAGFGTAGAVVLGYLFHVAKVLIDRMIAKSTLED